MTDFAASLRDVIDALVIHRPDRFWWFGRRSDPLPRAMRRSLSSEESLRLLRHRLEWQLYDCFYCRGFAVAVREIEARDPKYLSPWIERLSAANRGHGCKESGWKAVRVGKATAMVRKNGLTLEVPTECLVEEGRSTVSVRLPKELLGISPGFYVALGDRSLPAKRNSFRVYWNLRAEGARAFVSHATEVLNSAEIPFRLKVVNDSTRYSRCDAAVLYLLQRDREPAYEAMEFLYRCLRSELKPHTPVFTKAIAPGVAIAEQPQQEKSFGQSRCAILAEGLLDADLTSQPSPQASFDSVVTAFRRHRISLQRPYLNPGSRDRYPRLE